MADRGLITSIPTWVRVSGIIALVLVGVVVSSMLLDSSGSGGHEGGRDRGSQMEGMDHNGGQTGPAAPSESEPANSAPSRDQIPPREGGPPDGPGDHTPPDDPDDPTPTPTHGSGDQTRSGGSRGH
jgi:hypothetical protein